MNAESRNTKYGISRNVLFINTINLA